MTKVRVQQELFWLMISGYKHEKKRNIMYVSKMKMDKGELILEAFHSMWTTLSDFAFLPVNCFQIFSCAKKEARKQQICWNCARIVISHEVLQTHKWC